MKCDRCGWTYVKGKAPEISGWPEHLPPPPPIPPAMNPHPIGRCCSPYTIGDEVYWDLGGADDDLPPLKARFAELTGIQGPSFHLEGDRWVMDRDPAPTVCAINVVDESVLPEHFEIFGDTLKRQLEVGVSEITAVERWPVSI